MAPRPSLAPRPSMAPKPVLKPKPPGRPQIGEKLEPKPLVRPQIGERIEPKPLGRPQIGERIDQGNQQGGRERVTPQKLQAVPTAVKPKPPALGPPPKKLDEMKPPRPAITAEERKLAKEQQEEEARLKKLEQEKKSKKKAVGKEAVKSRQKARQEKKETRLSKVEEKEKEELLEVGAEGMTVSELADFMAVAPTAVVKELFIKGVMVQMNSTLDPDTVKVAAAAFGVEVLDKIEGKVEDAAKKTSEFIEEGDLENLVLRPPVVTIMGHVDHGKTSLLDYIRSSQVAAGEAGGITQGIGAYNVDVDTSEGKKTICFLDTPGHEAFSAMRARGAKVTDLAIIIVAADDGVRPQTLEAINHAKAAEVPIIIAINKIDREGAQPERVMQEISAQTELIPEEWGGKTPMARISAKKGTGVSELLETIVLVSELEEFQANPETSARGTVIESQLEKKQGALATLLIQNGTLKVGDIIQAGIATGKVRTMKNSRGDLLEQAGPSYAVQVLGLNAVPTAGEEFQVYQSEQEAREKAENLLQLERQQRLQEMGGGGAMVRLSSLATVDEEDEAIQRINFILRADATGALEAIKAALGQLPQDSVVLRFLHTAAGQFTVSDVDLAVASEGKLLGFNVQPPEPVLAAAKQKGVDIRDYTVIYDLVDDVRAMMEGRIKEVDELIPIGEGEVKAVFGTGNKKVAGCMVNEGRFEKGSWVVVTRGKGKQAETIFSGEMTSLRRVKDNVKVVEAGLECGIGCTGFLSWQEGDKINCSLKVKKQLKLEEAHATQAVDIEEELVLLAE